MSPRVPRPSPSCCWKVLGLEPPGDNSEPGEAGRGLKEFWGWETSEGREWGWRGSGCTSMKGPDYRPELESCVGESTEQVPPAAPPFPGIWASLGGEQTDGKVEKEERRVEGGHLRAAASLRGNESGMGHCGAARPDSWVHMSWEGNRDLGSGMPRFLSHSLCRGVVHWRSQQEYVPQPAQTGGLPGWLSGLPGLGGPQRAPPRPHR